MCEISCCALDCTIYPLRNGLIGRNRQFSQSFIGLSAIAIFVLIGFYTSGVIQHFIDSHDLFVLKPKCPMTIDEMLYYATCIKANQYKYSYGRQANKTLRELPIPAYESIPQWVYGAIKRAATDFTHLLQIAE